MINWCPKNTTGAGSQPATEPLSVVLRTALGLGPARPGGRSAMKMLPANQQRPEQLAMSEAALKARQSPAMSLFNRLDGLVHQLQPSRDFFAHWPSQLCQRIRAEAGPATGGQGRRQQQQQQNGSAECWNGRNFSG